jgi:putative lipoprotein (rSAM/lipoprotein system)
MSKAVCSCICGLLGASCADGPYDHKTEYGVPHARYRLDGVVRDHETHEAVRGIRVRIRDWDPADTSGAVRSNDAGEWAIDETRFPCVNACSLRVEDTDGSMNGGSYATRTVPISPTRTEPPDGWYEGTFEQHGVEIEITPRETDPSRRADRRSSD